MPTWNFERKVFAPFYLHARRFHGGEETVKILAALTEGGVNQAFQLSPDSWRLLIVKKKTTGYARGAKKAMPMRRKRIGKRM